MHRKNLAIGISILFLLTVISPLSMGWNGEESRCEDHLQNLIDYVYSSPDDIDIKRDKSNYDLASYDPITFNPKNDRTEDYYDIPYLNENNTKYVPLPQNIGPIDSAWPMFCHDNHHTGLSPYTTAQNPGVEKWRFKTQSSVKGGIAIDTDSTLYFGDSYGRLYALYPNGTLKWQRDAMGMITTSTPCITEDGYIYIAGHSKLQKWDRNGTRIWSAGIGGNSASAPAVADDGTIYIGSSSYDILAFYPNGTRKWSFPTGYYVTSDAAIADDGTIIFGSGDTWIYALYPNGTLRWKYKTGHVVKGSASIDDNGIIYMASGDDHLYAFYPNGTLKWRSNLGYGSETNPSFGPDGTIYYSYNGVWAVDPSDGSIKWKFNYLEDDEIAYLSSPAVSAEGIIYIGTEIDEIYGGQIYAINPDGTLRWRKLIADTNIGGSPSIAEDGTVYIGSSWLSGRVHAFNEWTGSNNPPSKPVLSGKDRVKVSFDYYLTCSANDTENNTVKFFVDWGDGVTSESPYVFANENYAMWHEYYEGDTFTIKAKAIDTIGAESDWSYKQIEVPYTYNYAGGQWLCERFPLLSRLLNLLGGIE